MSVRIILSSLFPVLLLCFFISASGKEKLSEKKQDVVSIVDRHADELISLSDQIWAFAETALKECNSSQILSDYAEQQGFTVVRGVAGLPTSFIASYGSGKPIIGVLGEFDALPGLSQKAIPEKEALMEGKPGHGCGHNLLGVGGIGAALAIKEMIKQGKLNGTIRFYGTPAEETYGGKAYMARAGLFSDLDVCLDWHPSTRIEANTQGNQAMIDFQVRFKGKTAHAAVDPWNGISAVDAMELYTIGINYLREHIKPTVRIHYLIEKAGEVVNVVPENVCIWTRIRDGSREEMIRVYEKTRKIAEGAALMTGANYSIELISGMYEILINRTGAEVLQKNLETLGPIAFTDEETRFAKQIQEAINIKPLGLDNRVRVIKDTGIIPNSGSSDVGDVSWNAPEITLFTTSAPVDVPWHSWAVTACSGMSIGHKSAIYSSKALAMTIVELIDNAGVLNKIRTEFAERKGSFEYKAILPDGPAPILVSE